MMLSSTPVTPTCHSEIAPMSQMLEVEQEIWGEGAVGIDPIIREQTSHGLHFKPLVEPLLLLLQATQLDGKALPEDSFTAMAVGTQVQQITGFWPVDIEVVTNRDVILEFESPIRPGEATQRLHRIREWNGQLADLGCLLTMRHSIMNLVEERENGHNRLLQLEEEQQRVRAEQREHQAQLAQFLTQFKEEVGKVEEMQKAHIIAPPSSTLVGAAVNNPDPKSLKTPSLPPFSGTEPVSKDEASCEQWVWQAREALKTYMLGAVRTAVIQSVRGEVKRVCKFSRI